MTVDVVALGGDGRCGGGGGYGRWMCCIRVRVRKEEGEGRKGRKVIVKQGMAPEVMEQLHGYDFKADIWSFSITALELAHGHAPFCKYPPMKVLLMTLQNAPPGLDYERDHKFSKSFKQMIASCLVKDPSKRPCAKKLLKHSFFKKARSNDYIARTLLEGLPDLGDRLKALKIKEEDMVAEKKILDGQKQEMSQNEYKRGLSDWNFNLEDLKAQASLVKTKCENCDDDASVRSSTHEPHVSQNSSPCIDDSIEGTMAGKRGVDVSRRREANSDELDEKAKPVVQLKGRFKVTSENADVEKVVVGGGLNSYNWMVPQHIVVVVVELMHPWRCSHFVAYNGYRFYSFSSSNPVVANCGIANRAVDGGCKLVNIAPIEKSLLEAAYDREKELLYEIADCDGGNLYHRHMECFHSSQCYRILMVC
ncbi:hypothetical protein Vadar_013660 [Vaccinium darrowii]|uniref:Uncharacterized protein n=1 Tax=Vaccinium darrowii TaxID=229202 RepID=A0ACB7YWA9_9ERIC|nr:hypothetical protein Vadar_013660 [Vaccinium darrowii]